LSSPGTSFLRFVDGGPAGNREQDVPAEPIRPSGAPFPFGDYDIPVISTGAANQLLGSPFHLFFVAAISVLGSDVVRIVCPRNDIAFRVQQGKSGLEY
jgi:hypothetical protein